MVIDNASTSNGRHVAAYGSLELASSASVHDDELEKRRPSINFSFLSKASDAMQGIWPSKGSKSKRRTAPTPPSVDHPYASISAPRTAGPVPSLQLTDQEKINQLLSLKRTHEDKKNAYSAISTSDTLVTDRGTLSPKLQRADQEASVALKDILKKEEEMRQGKSVMERVRMMELMKAAKRPPMDVKRQFYKAVPRLNNPLQEPLYRDGMLPTHLLDHTY